MGYLTCKFVRPDKQLFEGKCASMTLVTYSGELGVLPGHASEICALGDGVVRIKHLDEDGGDERDVVVSGGYAEICNDVVVIIADHARATDDIDAETVRRTHDKAQAKRDALPEGDHQRAYYENKMAWCDLLLEKADATAASE